MTYSSTALAHGSTTRLESGLESAGWSLGWSPGWSLDWSLGWRLGWSLDWTLYTKEYNLSSDRTEQKPKRGGLQRTQYDFKTKRQNACICGGDQIYAYVCAIADPYATTSCRASSS